MLVMKMRLLLLFMVTVMMAMLEVIKEPSFDDDVDGGSRVVDARMEQHVEDGENHEGDCLFACVPACLSFVHSFCLSVRVCVCVCVCVSV